MLQEPHPEGHEYKQNNVMQYYHFYGVYPKKYTIQLST